MNKLAAIFLLFITYFNPVYALTTDDLPDEMYLSQHWISHTASFDIETKTRKIGTLYRRFFSIPLKYDFYDYNDNLLTTARARFFSINTHLDVFDVDNTELGFVEEKIFTFLPSFTMYTPDGLKLAYAKFNFWGTQFTVYDAITDNPIATMSRSFFRIKNDWTIQLQDKMRLVERNINPSLLLTVLAFQCDREYWEQQNNNRNANKPVLSNNNIGAYKKSLQQYILPKQSELEALATRLETEYKAEQNLLSENNADPNAEVEAFISFCLKQVEANTTDDTTKKAILYLLEQQFHGVIEL